MNSLVVSEANLLRSTPPSDIVARSFFSRIHKLLALLVIAWMNNGIFTFAMPYVPNYIRYGLFGAWFSFALIQNHKFAKRIVAQCWPILFFYFYLLTISLFVDSINVDVYIKSISYLIMVYVIFLYYFDDAYRSFSKVLAAFLFADCVFLAINTYMQLQKNPLLARILTSPTATERWFGDTTFHGVGNYGYFYALAAVILLLGFLFLNYRKMKLFSLLLIIAFTMLLIKASFTISILFVFGFLISMVCTRYTSKTFFAFALVVACILILLSQGFLASMFESLAQIQGISYDVSTRLYEISYFFSGDSLSGSDLASRLHRYTMSLDAFAHNPFFGTSVSSSEEYVAGGHSAWLDSFAHFGMMCALFFTFLYKAYKYVLNRVPEQARPFVKTYWLYFIALGFVNPLLFSAIFAAWFLLMPMILTTLFNSRKKETV